jgi:hypothetical protein
LRVQKAILVIAGSALVLFPVAKALDAPTGRFDGNWNTHLACEAHGETPAYAWDFPSTIKATIFHGMHSAPGGPGYLVIDGPIGHDGNAKLSAKGTVTQSQRTASSR